MYERRFMERTGFTAKKLPKDQSLYKIRPLGSDAKLANENMTATVQRAVPSAYMQSRCSLRREGS